MSAVLTKVLADLRRRRLQAAVIAIVIFLASGTTTLGLTLLQTSSDPWQRAFNAQRGAHLEVFFDGRKVGHQELEGTPALIGASASGGPWVAVDNGYALGTRKFGLFTVGRDSPEAPVEVIRLAAGRWVQAPGEIVVTRSFADFNHVAIGDRLVSLGGLEKPSLRVVGQAIDVDEGDAETSTQFAWVTEAQARTLAPRSGYKMVYRFATPPGDGELRAKIAQLQAGLPAGTVTGSFTYLLLKRVFNITNQVVLTFLLAFGVFALLASAATVGNLVTGIVIASYREIGIMKAVGFTPFQVVAALVGQMLAPALAGCLFGIPAGALLSLPLVDKAARSLGLPPEPSFAPAMAALTLLGVLAVVAGAAGLPALRAGRLSAVRAISLGSAPAGSGRAGFGAPVRRLPLPRALALGAGDSFARPLRGALTALAVLGGVATLVFAIGLRSGMQSFEDLGAAGQGDVTVSRSSAYPDQKLMATLESQPETAAVVARAGSHVVIPGVADPVNVVAFRGDSKRLRIPIIRGRWFNGPGEVVVPRATLDEAHLRIGDRFPGVIAGRPIQLQVVGEIFSVNNFGHEVHMDLATLDQVEPDATPGRYVVFLKPGSQPADYARRVLATEPDFLDVSVSGPWQLSAIATLNTVMLVLAAVLALIAVVGVFNTLLLSTRERARDVAVLKAVGMTPVQVMTMVAAAAAVLGVVGGVLGLPAGMGVYRTLMTALGSFIGNDIPPRTFDVFNGLQLALLALAGLAVALLGALLPARWAAQTRVAEVLHSE